ncbi:MAG: SAM-dependent methyltransferase [Candidatus Woesearchaeota archaeon]
MSKENMREIVRSGYNKGQYDTTYARKTDIPEDFEKALCDELIKRTKPGNKLLDLGCGVGLPHDKYFIKHGLDVTGIDISEKHIEKARENVKEAKYFVGDFFSEDIEAKYDAIVSFYAIFHIPREEHQKLLERIHSLLNDKGIILITLGVEDMGMDTEDDFAGAKMAWSSYDSNKNKELVRKAGFEILIASEDLREEKHLWILAKKKLTKNI